MSSPQPLVVGINFGTSNSAAALIDANGVLQVIPLNGDKAEQHTVLYGSEAMRAFQGLKPLDELLFECVHILKRLIVKMFFA